MTNYLDVLLGAFSAVVTILVGLPLFLHSTLAFCKLIPGSQPDMVVEKLYNLSQTIANGLTKYLPSKK